MKLKIGVFGAGRGRMMVEVMSQHPDAELVAICDVNQNALNSCKDLAEKYDSHVALYTDFDKFIEHGLDGIVLANYADEHAPYAIKCLKAGINVVSEVLAVKNLEEAKELVTAVENSKAIYAYAENYCYFRSTLEMQRLYKQGDVGEFLHGEGEYVHFIPKTEWGNLTGQNNPNHWRNRTPATFYCTHSTGPLLTITGLRATSVVAMETNSIIGKEYGYKRGDGCVMICEMSNGGTAKFLPWCNFPRTPHAVWYSVYGTKGMMESARWGNTIDTVNIYKEEGQKLDTYVPTFDFETDLSKKISGHGGSDFYTMDYFIASILDREDKHKMIDVYQALDMTLIGTLGAESLKNNNAKIEIPDFRKK